jgi:hypothetical protein
MVFSVNMSGMRLAGADMSREVFLIDDIGSFFLQVVGKEDIRDFFTD